MPVSPRFVDGLMEKEQARRRLGWALEKLTVLMIGGGEGMGRLYETARLVDARCPDIKLAVVAGRNQDLHHRLLGAKWQAPTEVFGFVDHDIEMPLLMSAADVLVTKAGPGTLHEAFLAGLPLILSGAVPGQEEGNVSLVVDAAAGVWAPDPYQVLGLIEAWTGDETGVLKQMGRRSRQLARPDAADAVAKEVWQLALTNL
jgi:1,2-diacylglycerol 3-beta-galactosyltransferase